MVEGGRRKRNNRSDSPVSILQNIASGDVQHPVAILQQKCIARSIARRTVATIVRLPIDFHDEAALLAIEVDDVRTDRMLSAKFEAGYRPAYALPYQHFGQAHFASKFARGVHFRATFGRHAPSTTLRAVPLPLQGRILFGDHAAHPFFVIHAWHAPFARSRTRPI